MNSASKSEVKWFRPGQVDGLGLGVYVCVCVCENTFKGNNNQRVGSNDELKKQSPEFGLICHVRCAQYTILKKGNTLQTGTKVFIQGE